MADDNKATDRTCKSVSLAARQKEDVHVGIDVYSSPMKLPSGTDATFSSFRQVDGLSGFESHSVSSNALYQNTIVGCARFVKCVYPYVEGVCCIE